MASRKFRHVNGFGDGTDYLEVTEDGKVAIHNSYGLSTEDSVYTLEDCLKFVLEGKWEELEEV